MVSAVSPSFVRSVVIHPNPPPTRASSLNDALGRPILVVATMGDDCLRVSSSSVDLAGSACRGRGSQPRGARGDGDGDGGGGEGASFRTSNDIVPFFFRRLASTNVRARCRLANSRETQKKEEGKHKPSTQIPKSPNHAQADHRHTRLPPEGPPQGREPREDTQEGGQDEVQDPVLPPPVHARHRRQGEGREAHPEPPPRLEEEGYLNWRPVVRQSTFRSRVK